MAGHFFSFTHFRGLIVQLLSGRKTLFRSRVMTRGEQVLEALKAGVDEKDNQAIADWVTKRFKDSGECSKETVASAKVALRKEGKLGEPTAKPTAPKNGNGGKKDYAKNEDDLMAGKESPFDFIVHDIETLKGICERLGREKVERLLKIVSC
jgi:hypothetical protein